MVEYFIQINLVKRTKNGLDITRQATVPFREETKEKAGNYETILSIFDATPLPFYYFVYIPDPDQTSRGDRQ